MRIAIHQPQYMPWLGYIDKIRNSDKFVFLDDVQYKKREFQNRNKIKTPDGFIWITVPVIVKGKYYQKINEVMINNSLDWQNDHLKALKYNYGASVFFEKYYPYFEEIYSKKWEYLCELNIAVIKLILKLFEVDTPCFMSSELNVNTEKTQRLIDICKKLNADEYFSGLGAKEYMVEEMFEKEGIKLVYQEFNHPDYTQNYNGFVSHLSAVDYLFNCGDREVL